MKTDLRKDADVKVTASTNTKNKPVAVIEVDGKYEHRFDANSRISKALELMSPVKLEERLQGGHFFFVNGCLFDFRDGNYNGFIHTDENIEALKSTIGMQYGRSRRTPGTNTQNTGVRLSKVWSSESIVVPGIDEGGAFDSQLTFSWNPFVETIRSSFDIVRLICENGMTGLTSLFSAKIPLLNRWEEHLDIADRQIQNQLNSMLAQRFTQMANEPATIQDLLLLQDHVLARLNSSEITNPSETQKLRGINSAIDPVRHLSRYYKSGIFADRRKAAQFPAHLTTFDAYNVATEIASHTNSNDSSSNHGLHKLANELVFDRRDRRARGARYAGPTKASFSDPDRAFFGDVEE